jgi:ammonia channel protein AmtB
VRYYNNIIAGITPTAGYIAENYQSIVLGFIMGVASFYFCMLIKDVAHIDDALVCIDSHILLSYNIRWN